MDAIASARIPVEVKRQGDRLLEEMGSSTTALINAAYVYLLETGTLPRALSQQPALRCISPEQRDAFAQFMRDTTLEAPASWTNKGYEELYEDAMRERYSAYYE